MELDRIIRIIYEKKGYDILIVDLRGISNIADHFVIASGYTNEHLIAIADAIENEIEPFREYGRGTRWLAIDYIEIIVHLFTEEAREYYDLEGLWIKAPQKKVKIEL